MITPDAAELALRIADLEDQVRALSTARQIARSTIEVNTGSGPVDLGVQDALSQSILAGVQLPEIREQIDAASDEAATARAAAEAALAEAAEATTTADGKNTVRASATRPVYENRTPGDLWYELDASGRIIGVQVWNGSEYVPYRLIADALLVPGSLGPTAIMDGSITTPKLAAGSVIASKMTITPANLLDDPLFTKPFGEVWVRGIVAGNYYGAWDIVETSQGRALHVTSEAGGYNVAITSNRVPVLPGERYKWNARVQTTGNPMIVRAVAFSKSGATTILGAVTIPANTTWADFSAEFDIPADRHELRFDFLTSSASPTAGQQAWLTDPKIARMATADLIVDGAITADKLAATAITGKTITGGTITGAKIRTAASGQRMETESNQIRFYDQTGASAGVIRGIRTTNASGDVTSQGISIVDGAGRTAHIGYWYDNVTAMDMGFYVSSGARITGRLVLGEGLEDLSGQIPRAMASGTTSTTAGAYTTVTLPANTFSSYRVVASNGSQGTVGVSRIVNKTPNSFQVGIWSLAGAWIAGTGVDWIAMEH